MEHANLKTNANSHTLVASFDLSFATTALYSEIKVPAQSLYLKHNCYQLFWNWHTAAIVHSLPETKKKNTLVYHKKKHSFDRSPLLCKV